MRRNPSGRCGQILIDGSPCPKLIGFDICHKDLIVVRGRWVSRYDDYSNINNTTVSVRIIEDTRTNKVLIDVMFSVEHRLVSHHQSYDEDVNELESIGVYTWIMILRKVG